MLPSNTTPGEQDAVAPPFAHFIDGADSTEKLASSIRDALIMPGGLPYDTLIPPGDHPYDSLTKRTTALRHQSESLLRAVGPKDYVFRAGGSEIEQLLKYIAKHIKNGRAWKKLGMVDPFAQSLKDRKIRTFQDSLLEVCDKMSQEAQHMQAGQARDSKEIASPRNCDHAAP